MTLLDASAQLSPVIRDRLLSEAAGNPLALTELPITAARLEPTVPASLPLTQRLEQAFAARVSDLPEATRLLLLVAAHSDNERLSEILEVASAMAGSTLGPDLLEPAAEAAIVDLDLHSVRFRHPLIRSAGTPERELAAAPPCARGARRGDRGLQLDMTWLVAAHAWLVDPAPAARRILIEAADRLGEPDSADLRILAIQAYADPFGKAPAILECLRAAAADLHHDADAARFLGPAAVAVGAFDIAATFLGEAVEGLRTQGRLGHLPRMLTLQGSMAAQVTDWSVAIPAAAEARRLATELREPQWIAAADTVDSIIAGIRGDQDAAERAAARAERIAVPTRANITVAFAQTGRIFAALGAGRHSDAYEAAERLLDPASPAHHPIVACWLIGDHAEAALHTGRVDEARARVKQVEAASGDIPGTCIAVGLLHARALLAEDPGEVTDRFDEALGADLTHWPRQRARLLLAYGRWLRRRRRIAESRTPLRDARDASPTGTSHSGCACRTGRSARTCTASSRSSGSPAAVSLVRPCRRARQRENARAPVFRHRNLGAGVSGKDYPRVSHLRKELPMCSGDRLVADFTAGTYARPGLPAGLDEHLTATMDGLWVVRAYKLARQVGDLFVPLRGGPGYPADARAECRVRGAHDAPDPGCTCGFHAVSSRRLPGLPVHGGLNALTVALSGRVLAFEWRGGGVLWRAERQTVVHVERSPLSDRMEGARSRLRRPDDPDGRLAVVPAASPHDSGPIRLNLPVSPPVLQVCHDDAGWCAGSSTFEHSPAALVLA